VGVFSSRRPHAASLTAPRLQPALEYMEALYVGLSRVGCAYLTGGQTRAPLSGEKTVGARIARLVVNFF